MKRSFARLTSILPPHGATIAARWKGNTHNWPARHAPSPAKQPCLTGQYREPRDTRNKKHVSRQPQQKKRAFSTVTTKKRSFVIRRAAASCRSTKKKQKWANPKKQIFPSSPWRMPLYPYPALPGRAFLWAWRGKACFPDDQLVRNLFLAV